MYRISQNASCGWMESQNFKKRVASLQFNDQGKKRNLLPDAVSKAQASPLYIILILTILFGDRA